MCLYTNQFIWTFNSKVVPTDSLYIESNHEIWVHFCISEIPLKFLLIFCINFFVWIYLIKFSIFILTLDIVFIIVLCGFVIFIRFICALCNFIFLFLLQNDMTLGDFCGTCYVNTKNSQTCTSLQWKTDRNRNEKGKKERKQK